VLRQAVDMFKEGFITKDKAITMVEGGHLDQLLHPQVSEAARRRHWNGCREFD
jgi:hypothetical protein